MLSYLLPFYETVRDFRTVMQAEGEEFDELQQSVNDVLDQFFVNTAKWNLDRWEKELGKTDTSKLYVTVSLIKNVTESYSNSEVELIEDHPNYQLTVKFVGVKGIPENLEDLKQAMENIMPAHLKVVYEFTYIRW